MVMYPQQARKNLNRRQYMSIKIKIMVWTATAVIFLQFVGCSHSEPTTRTDMQLGSPSAASSTSAGPQGPTAVESAIALSDKYAKLSEEATALRQKKQTLETENQKLETDLKICHTQLEQAQKELAQANDLLLQTRLELNSWKNDVLGFRGEMRDAQKAQLETLYKILKLMGGEANQPGNTQTHDSKE
jgi:septal ring factor EnvC (AmiA/AmiB activator)